MPRLLIKCSECRAIIDTGMTADLASFCKSEFKNNKIQCNACESDLTWNEDDVLAISFCAEKLENSN